MGEIVKKAIQNGKTALGIELGSTRIKSVLVDENNVVIASGSHMWENSYINGVWTYNVEEIWNSVQASYQNMSENVKKQYGITLQTIGAIGFSGMMHGYMAFDKEGELLVPFRTWRNNITEQASKELTERFNYPIPQRWSIAHLYQAILNREDHVGDIRFLTTVAGYVHWKLTGHRVLGIGEASGIFPIDLNSKKYNQSMIDQFNELNASKDYTWKLEEILPNVLVAGEYAGELTKKGAKLLDISGELQAGIPLCPPEGDAGTGMIATNSIVKRTGNVSAGTSAFAMVVLEKELSKVYHEIDLVTTPTGNLVAMAHSNNCSSDLNAWIGLFEEFSNLMGMEVSKNDLYDILFKEALKADPDGGGLLSYGYFSGEHMTYFEEGRPLFVRSSDSNFNLANFMRTHLFTAFSAMRIGMDILLNEEKVKLDEVLGHGGIFNTEGVGQEVLAAAFNVPVSTMENAGEGGAWGISLLGSYMINKKENETLEDYLNEKVFPNQSVKTISPNTKNVEGFKKFMERYKAGLLIERAAIDNLK